ncbi:MAG: hypothetical protein Q7S16_04035 [bacterium]|nr:hypothetical protein [bacterium]
MPKQKLPDKNFKWSPKLAYAIGLLTTDGNLSGDGRHISLRSCDIDQIKTFKKCLNLSNKIGAPKPAKQNGGRICYHLQFGDVQFYRWLLKIGLFPAKSYTVGPLKIPDKFFRDFLRGHLDGDGSITTYQDHYNTSKHPSYIYTRLFVRFISASRNHMEWIRKNVKKFLDIDGDFFERRPARKGYVSIWQLKFMKKESIKLLHWLYYKKDIPALSRKRKMAEQALAAITKIKRKVYTFH